MELYDIHGKVIVSRLIKEETQISVQSLVRGLYLLRITHKGKSLSSKVVVE
jgi:hypothetical protein